MCQKKILSCFLILFFCFSGISFSAKGIHIEKNTLFAMHILRGPEAMGVLDEEQNANDLAKEKKSSPEVIQKKNDSCCAKDPCILQETTCAKEPCVEKEVCCPKAPIIEEKICEETQEVRCSCCLQEARNCVPCGIGMVLTVDPFLWTPRENGLAFGIKNPHLEEIPSDGKVVHPSYSWDFGFRFGLGGKLPHDGWDVDVQWTHYTTKAKRHVYADQGGSIFLNWGNPSLSREIERASEAEGKWRLVLNRLQTILGRDFYVGKCLTLKPFIGLETSWIHQNYDIHYGEVTSDPVSDRFIHMKNNFWGMGPYAGVHSKWKLISYWSLYGNLEASLLAGRFARVTQEYPFMDEETNRTLSISDKLSLSSLILNWALGFQWDVNASNHCHISIKLGYEQQLYLEQNQFMLPVLSSSPGSFVSNQGDLSLQGVTLSVLFDY